MITVAIVGSSGYSGQETLDRVLAHPELELHALGSDSLAGSPAHALDPRLTRLGLPAFVSNDVALESGAELVFCCLGHERAAALEPPAGAVVVDLSGAHRLAAAAAYEEWYGFVHPQPVTLGEWSYALPELSPPPIATDGGALIANPGCYATAALLALAPLVGAIEPESVVVDAKSGVSGAGRALKESSHANTVLDNVAPYRVGAHQHEPEIAQALGFDVCFVPHLLPVRRGLVATCYARPTADDLRERLEAAYATSDVVTMLPDGTTPELARVQGTDAAELALFADRATGRAIVICALDNLGKGAAGQAVQNANLALGLDETAGLRLTGVCGMSVTAPKGFVAAGVHAGIRKEKADLALLRSTAPAVGAAMFTTNRLLAAPVVVSKAHLAESEPQAVVINSGVANAATGLRGELDAVATAAEAARLLGLDAEQVLVLSTGVIGALLPLEKVTAGLAQAAPALAADGGAAAAEAIMTTDTRPKTAVVARDGFVVGGMAKGAGMIHPALATMLAVVTTDYPLEAGEADSFLRPAVEESFNRISIDGECSTNDAVVLLANGASGCPRNDASFAAALREVCADLSAQIVADGEGATVLLEIEVAGAATAADASAIARRIATSPLVKTAAFGRDANWGRVLAAAGSAPSNGGFAQLDQRLLSLSFNGTSVFAGGAPTAHEPSLEGAVCRIELDLGLGAGTASYLSSDLSYDYVRINAEYRS